MADFIPGVGTNVYLLPMDEPVTIDLTNSMGVYVAAKQGAEARFAFVSEDGTVDYGDPFIVPAGQTISFPPPISAVGMVVYTSCYVNVSYT